MTPERNDTAQIVTDFPNAVQDLEHVWIPMSDGVRLSARIWMPENAQASPVPAILEYIPYRKRDGTRVWDEPRHRYWAGHGYACIRLDIRGTGDSEGLITDEYARQEQDDAVEAIAWIAAQPWCAGKVGMTGISWGGFNALQVAARRPPALRAIITHCSTDDRYADDVHYMGGCPLIDNFFWGSAFFMLMARPGDPEIQGRRWRDQWMERLEHWEPVAATIWQRHPQRDRYWKHGSVCENHADIECAVYAVGGWNDGYSNAVPRLLAHLECPKKGLVGPWGHKYPHDAIPGPSIGFLQHALRWWDHWLKDEDTGIMDESEYTVWLDEPQAPLACLPMSKGRWVAEPAWPSPNIDPRTLFLNADGLAATSGPVAVLEHRSPETIGAGGGVWCPYGLGGSSPDLPVDQREDDAKSLCFEAAPLVRPARDPRRAARDAAPFHRQAPGHGGTAAERRRARRHVRTGYLRSAEPLPTRRPGAGSGDGSGRRGRGAGSAERLRSRLSGRPPHSDRAFHFVLSHRVDCAGALHSEREDRRQLPRPAGAAAARRGRDGRRLSPGGNGARARDDHSGARGRLAPRRTRRGDR